MKDNTTISKKVQHQIKRFSYRMTRDLSRPKKKFISQALYGIQASRDVKLSNIARSLSEDIDLLQTEKRLSRHIISKDITENINNALMEEARFRIQEDTVIALDLSDINKPFARKMDYLANVWDGSEGKPAPGYWICEAVGANVNDESPIPLYSELYSHEADGFESENEQILKAVRLISSHADKRGIFTMDRAADRKILVGELDRLGLRFVIRAKGKRNLKDIHGRTRRLIDIVRSARCRECYTVKIDKEGYEEEIELRLARKDNLFIDKTKISLIIVKGFGKDPMILITNVDKNPKDILEIYLTRWKCEETFRFLKHEYHLEDVRVRRYTALRNTVALIHAVFYFLSVYLGRRLKMKILLEKILERAKRFFQIPAFKHYAVADGIYRLLFNRKWNSEIIEDCTENKKQLLFGFL